MATKSENRKINIYINSKLANKNLKDLKVLTRKLNNEIDQLTPGTEAYRKKMLELKSAKSILKKHRQEIYNVQTAWQKVKKRLGPLVGILGGLFAVGKVISYGKELARLGYEAAGVNLAFTRLGEEGRKAFNDIKQATRGTLSNLDIKKAINEFAAFKLPLEDSGALFEFLNLQSIRLGKNIKELAPSLVEGLSKESKLRIDNLGISAKVLNAELKKTPNFAKAVANIAKREIATAGDIIDRTVNKQAKWNAAIKNSEERLANGFIKDASDAFYDLGTNVLNAVFPMKKLSDEIKEEQVGLNVLVNSITDTNVKEGERLGLIKQLNDKYPFFLKNLGKEETSNEAIRDRLNEVNDLYIKRIALQSQRENIEEALEEAGERALTVAEKRIEVNKQLAKTNTKLFDGKLDLTNKSLEERVDLVKKELKARATYHQSLKTGASTATNDYARALDDLDSKQWKNILSVRKNTEANEELEEQQNKMKLVEEELGTSLAEINKIFEIKTKTTKKSTELTDEEEKAIKKLNDSLQRLKETTSSLQEKRTIDSAEDPELAKIEAKYQKQIDFAKSFVDKEGKILEEANVQKIALEKLRDDEIEQYKLQKKEKEQEKKAEFEAQLQQEIAVGYDLAVLNLDNHYQNLIALAEGYGIDTTDIIAKYESEALKIKQEFDAKEVETEKDKNAKIQEERVRTLKNQAQSFSELGGLAQSFYGLLKDEGEKYTEAQKVLKLSQIALDTASAISSLTAMSEANPANAVTGGLAGIAQFISGFARIINNIGQAKKLLSTAQKDKGGYYQGDNYSVVGADDGKTYNAKYVGRHSGGMLYDPSLVLAAENKPEYYVPNPLLSHPTVANHVRVIESIRTGKQMNNGGFDKPFSATTQSTTSTTQQIIIPGQEELMNMISRLNSTLEAGIYAKADGKFADDMFDIKSEQDSIRGN